MELLRIFGSSSLLFLMKVTGGHVQIQGKKIQKGIRPGHLEQAWSIKNLLTHSPLNHP